MVHYNVALDTSNKHNFLKELHTYAMQMSESEPIIGKCVEQMRKEHTIIRMFIGLNLIKKTGL